MQDNYDNFSFNINNTKKNIYYSEYNLINEKIDKIIRGINYNRELILNANQIEEFISSKLNFSQFFLSLEEELIDFLGKYKNLFIQNKQISEKCENLNTKNRNLELKLYSEESQLNEYKNNIEQLINTLNFQKEKNFSKDEYIRNIEQKLKLVERNLILNYSKTNFNKHTYNYNSKLSKIRNDGNECESYEFSNKNKYGYGNNFDVKNENLKDYNSVKNYSTNNNISIKFDGLNYYEKYNNYHGDKIDTNKELVKGFLSNYDKNPNLKNIEDVNIGSSNNIKTENDNLQIKENCNQKDYKLEENILIEEEQKNQVQNKNLNNQINNGKLVEKEIFFNNNYEETSNENLKQDILNDLESEKVNFKFFLSNNLILVFYYSKITIK
jgi:hypothetical protein